MQFNAINCNLFARPVFFRALHSAFVFQTRRFRIGIKPKHFRYVHFQFFCSRTDSILAFVGIWLQTVEVEEGTEGRALCWLRFACTWISHGAVDWIKLLWIRGDYGIIDQSMCLRSIESRKNNVNQFGIPIESVDICAIGKFEIRLRVQCASSNSGEIAIRPMSSSLTLT